MIHGHGSRRALKGPSWAQWVAWHASVTPLAAAVRLLDHATAFGSWACGARVTREPGGWHITFTSEGHRNVTAFLLGPLVVLRWVLALLADAAALALGGTVERRL